MIDKLSKFKNKKIIITGHTGFKGSWLTIILTYLGSTVDGFSLKPKKKSLFNKSMISKHLRFNTYGDINNIKKLSKKIKQCKPEIIFHLAAQPLVLESYKDPLRTFNTNIIGTLNVLETIRNASSVKSVIIVTTDKVYKTRKKNGHYKESDQLGGFDPYSVSKVGAEIITDSYVKSFFKKTTLENRVSTVRAGNVIGGGDFSKNRLVPDIINAINKNTKISIRNSNSIRPWQHVLDPLIGYLILAEKQFANKVNNDEHSWNFGPDKNNFKRVIDIVKYITKYHKFKYSLIKNSKYQETKILKLNSSKSKKKLHWIPKWNLTKSLIKTLEWNVSIKKGIPAKDLCISQFLMYVSKN